jgi:hypothetical protein
MSIHSGFDTTAERKHVMNICEEDLNNTISHLHFEKRPQQLWSADGFQVTIFGDTQESLSQLHTAFKRFSWRPAEWNGTQWCVTYRIQ